MSTASDDEREGGHTVDAPNRTVPVRGTVLIAALAVSAAAMLGAASLGWPGVPILVAFLAVGCGLLLRWSR